MLVPLVVGRRPTVVEPADWVTVATGAALTTTFDAGAVLLVAGGVVVLLPLAGWLDAGVPLGAVVGVPVPLVAGVPVPLAGVATALGAPAAAAAGAAVVAVAVAAVAKALVGAPPPPNVVPPSGPNPDWELTPGTVPVAGEVATVAGPVDTVECWPTSPRPIRPKPSKAPAETHKGRTARSPSQLVMGAKRAAGSLDALFQRSATSSARLAGIAKPIRRRAGPR